MKKCFVKTVIVTALTVIIAGNMTTTAMAHHSHSSDRAPQNTSCHQNSHCNDDAYRDNNYCDICGACHGGEYAYCGVCQTCHGGEYAYCDVCQTCHNGEYCDAYGTYHNDAHCAVDDAYRDETVCEARKHHARFYCGSREEYYSRKNCKVDCF